MTRDVLSEVSQLLGGVYNADNLITAMPQIINLDNKLELLPLHTYVQDPAVLLKMCQYMMKEGDSTARSILDSRRSL